MIRRFFCAARSISSSPCAELLVNGFSTNTCLPFSSAAFASSKCVQTGETIATASISVDRITSIGSRSDLDPRIRLLRASLRGSAQIRDRQNLGPSKHCEVPDNVWSPVTVTNYSEIHDPDRHSR